ncbi:MAG: xecD 1 [Gemmatimonadetes bacterium]|nr:xecD 1 [Gemmatimonadota bacterium]
MSGELDGKAIVVTGASMGIGFACAEELLERGASVMLCARGEDDLAQAAQALALRYPGKVASTRADVSKPADVDRLFDAAHAAHGRLDGVAHCAGVYGPIGPVTQIDPEEWFAAIRVNLLGSFLVTQRAAREMTRSGGGSIVLMSGGGAATPFPNYTSYACGKVGVVRLTETVAIELSGTGVRVNCVAPGFVLTRLHQQTLAAGVENAGNFVEATQAQIAKGGVPPQVAARAVAFLMSDRSAKITGRFLAAPYDSYDAWPDHAAELEGSDLFTLRRIVPRDRGQDWQ